MSVPVLRGAIIIGLDVTQYTLSYIGAANPMKLGFESAIFLLWRSCPRTSPIFYGVITGFLGYVTQCVLCYMEIYMEAL